MFEQSYSFGFEAAHELGQSAAAGPDHPYAHVHGHSFEVTVTLAAHTLSPRGWVMDFAAVREACEAVRTRLDHRFLNHVDGLETPTLEVLARWVFHELADRLPVLAVVEIARPSLRERVRYRPPQD